MTRSPWLFLPVVGGLCAIAAGACAAPAKEGAATPQTKVSSPRSTTTVTRQVAVNACCTFELPERGAVRRENLRLIDTYDHLEVQGDGYLLRIDFEPGSIGWQSSARGNRLLVGGVPALLAQNSSTPLANYATNRTLVVPLRRGQTEAGLTIRISCMGQGCGITEQVARSLRFTTGWRSDSRLAPANSRRP